MAQRYHRVAQATALFPELKSQELLAGAWRRMPSPFLLLRDQPLLCMGRDQWQGGLPISECCQEFEFICALWCSPGKTYCPWTATLELSLSSKGPILAAREKITFFEYCSLTLVLNHIQNTFLKMPSCRKRSKPFACTMTVPLSSMPPLSSPPAPAECLNLCLV